MLTLHMLTFLAPLFAAAGAAPAASRAPALPRYFEENRGQAGPGVRFLARGRDYVAAIGGEGADFRLGGRGGRAAARLRFPGSRPSPAIEGLDPQPGYSNYFLGNDPAKWRRRVPHFARVRYRSLYPGIDLVYRHEAGKLEYDFVVAPGADPGRIQAAWEGVDSMRLNAAGDLVLRTAAGEMVQHRPRVYQESPAGRVEVAAGYRIGSSGRVRVEMARYDRTRELVIDPVLSYATLLGAEQTDTVINLHADSQGNVYVSGWTDSATLPTSSPTFDASLGTEDGYVVKFNPATNTLLYATYVGGGAPEWFTRMAVDPQGNAYLFGITESADFPLRDPYKAAMSGATDYYLMKLDPTGSNLVYSTYFGGSGDEGRISDTTQLANIGYVAVDAHGQATITSVWYTADLPTTEGAYDRTKDGLADVFVARFQPDGRSLVFCTYLGGGAEEVPEAMTLDGAGNTYVAGYTYSANFPTTEGAAKTARSGPSDAFIFKLNAAGSGLVYSTLIGGNSTERIYALAADAAGRAYAAGITFPTGFPVTPGAAQTTFGTGWSGFLLRLNFLGTGIQYSTLLGRDSNLNPWGIAVAPNGVLFATGNTSMTAFPVTPDALSSLRSGTLDGFLTVVNPAGTAWLYSTYLGGAGWDTASAVARADNGSVWVGGSTDGVFPFTAGAYDNTANGGRDAFLAQFSGFTDPYCVASLATPTATFPSGGGSFTINHTVAANCEWFTLPGLPSATAIQAGAAGTGPGPVTYSVGAWNGAAPRALSLTTANAIHQIIQAGPAAASPFTDVPAAHPYFHHLLLMQLRGITSGCRAGEYCPDAGTTRSQMAVFIVRAMLGGDNFAFPSGPYFTDVPSTHPHFKWVQKMRELRITSGVTATEYRPDDAVTRGQMAVFIIRAIMGNTFPFFGRGYFQDVPSSHPYFAYIQKLKEFGITGGLTATTYGPDQPITRGQMGVFLIRAFAAAR